MMKEPIIALLLAATVGLRAEPSSTGEAQPRGSALMPWLPLRVRSDRFNQLVIDRESGHLIAGWMTSDPAILSTADYDLPHDVSVRGVAAVCGGTILCEWFHDWQPCQLLYGRPAGFRLRGMVLSWNTNKSAHLFDMISPEQALEDIRDKLHVMPDEVVDRCYLYWESDPGSEGITP